MPRKIWLVVSGQRTQPSTTVALSIPRTHRMGICSRLPQDAGLIHQMHFRFWLIEERGLGNLLVVLSLNAIMQVDGTRRIICSNPSSRPDAPYTIEIYINENPTLEVDSVVSIKSKLLDKVQKILSAFKQATNAMERYQVI